MHSDAPAVVIYRDELLAYSETFIASQADALTRYRPVFAATRIRAGSALPRHPIVPLDGNRLSSICLKLLRRPSREWIASLAAHAPRLVHAHFGPDGFFAIPIARALGIPLVVTFHGYDITTRASSSPAHAIWAALRGRVFRHSNTIIAVSGFIRDKLLEHGCPPAKVVVHHIGVDTERFAPMGVEREPVVLFVGRLAPKKGCGDLIRAMAIVEQSRPDVKLRVIGDGELREPLEKEASAMLANFEFVGRRSHDEVREAMSRASVFCLPSVTAPNGETEGLPIVLLEAQSMGLPVVTTRHSGSVDAVADGITGFVVEEHDVTALARSIRELLENRELRVRMSEAGRKRVVEHFDIRAQTRKLETIYDDACSSR